MLANCALDPPAFHGALLRLRKLSAIGFRHGLKREMAVARRGGRAAAAAVDRGRSSKGSARHHVDAPAQRAMAAEPEHAAASITASPAFHERFLIEEGCAAAFRIDAGGGWATGALPAGANENEIAHFLSEAISLAKQMQAAMGGRSVAGQSGDGQSEDQVDAAAVQILIADPQAGVSRQSAIQVSVESSGGTAVTLQPGGGAGHLVTMLQHFLMALNLPPRDDRGPVVASGVTSGNGRPAVTAPRPPSPPIAG
jgi:hypothetical protein